MLTSRFNVSGGSYTAPIAKARELLDPSARGWTVSQEFKAVHGGGKTFIGYIDTDGDAYVFSVDDETQATSTPFALHGSALDPGGDPHDAPVILIRPDGRLVVAYSPHGGSTCYRRISTNPYDATAFGSEASLDASIGGTDYTYMRLAQLSGESDKIYLGFRNFASSLGHFEISTSTDGGSTFSARTRVFTPTGTRAYARIATNSIDRIDVVTTHRDPSISTPASLYHIYYEAGDWHDSDGTVLTLPATTATATLVKASSTGQTINCGGVTYDDDGNPVALLLIERATSTDVHQARWNGSSWVETTILDNLTLIDDNAYYPAAMLAHNPDVVFCAIETGSFFEMHRLVSTDAGATWTTEQRTTGSAADHAQPIAVVNPDPSLVMAWLYGDGGTGPSYADGDWAIWGGY